MSYTWSSVKDCSDRLIIVVACCFITTCSTDGISLVNSSRTCFLNFCYFDRCFFFCSFQGKAFIFLFELFFTFLLKITERIFLNTLLHYDSYKSSSSSLVSLSHILKRQILKILLNVIINGFTKTPKTKVPLRLNAEDDL